jgi:hypothetical protein
MMLLSQGDIKEISESMDAEFMKKKDRTQNQSSVQSFVLERKDVCIWM